jgi:hypothetical protein
VGRPGTFKKGQSGNPAGRPKQREEFVNRARKAVDEYVLEAWIEEVMEKNRVVGYTGKEGKVEIKKKCRGPDWVKASELLAAYGYGKPKQVVEASGPGGGGIPIESKVMVYLPDNGRGGAKPVVTDCASSIPFTTAGKAKK